MKTIYLVRHGEAENNVRAPSRFKAKPALTELGHGQAKIIAERAAHLPMEALIASTMTRAHETALHISTRISMPIESSDLFVERRCPTTLFDRLWDDPETQKILKEWERTCVVDDARVLDGENFADLRSRAQQALEYLEKRPESDLLVVTHGVFLRVLAAYVLFSESLTPEQFESFLWGMKMQNTGLTVLRYDREEEHHPWHLLVWNDQRGRS